jgi:amino acid transporter
MLFLVHCATLLVLVGFSGYKFFSDDFKTLKANWDIENDVRDHWARSLYYGFGAAMLGITGFETSANFVEEQAPGVFPLTLRNMWIAVSFFNPVLSLFSFGLLPLATVTDPTQSGNIVVDENNNILGALLSLMAKEAAGPWLVYWVSIDAVLVLSGAVLTAYVGVTGLVRRLALDRILAQMLLAENKLRGTNHYIIIGFFLLCSSLFAVVGGQTGLQEM